MGCLRLTYNADLKLIRGCGGKLPREEKVYSVVQKSGAEACLYYYGARYYDPAISLWLSVDPLAEITMTPYQYTYQNPIRYIDPTGMAGDDVIEVTKGTGEIKVTKAAGDDVVRLRNEYTGEVEKEYTYGENGSFSKDNWIVSGKDDDGNKTTTIHSTQTDKLFKLFKFASHADVEFGYLKFSSNTGVKTGVLATSHRQNTISLPYLYNGILKLDGWTMDEMWHSHPEAHAGQFNDFPSGFNHDGTHSWNLGDRVAFGMMRERHRNRIPNKGNIYSPSTNKRIIYDDKTFKTIENYK